MQELRELLQGGPGDPGLDLAVLQIATIEYPELVPESFVEILDSYGRELSERLNPSADGEEFIHTMNEYMFEELGFQGNQQEYYHPANSCLNEVLTKRIGIPITLSVVYMEIARRVGRTVHGIGLAGPLHRAIRGCRGNSVHRSRSTPAGCCSRPSATISPKRSQVSTSPPMRTS